MIFKDKKINEIKINQGHSNSVFASLTLKQKENITQE